MTTCAACGAANDDAAAVCINCAADLHTHEEGRPPAPYGPPPQYGAPPAYGPAPYQPQSPYGPAPGYPPSYGYPPGPGYGGYGPAAASTNGMAVASLVLGILWIYWVGSILALIFGYLGKRQIEQSGGRQQGRGLAIAGIVLGWVGVGVLALLLVLGLIGALAFDSTFG